VDLANFEHGHHITMDLLNVAVFQILGFELIFQSFTTQFEWPDKDILSAIAMLSEGGANFVSIDQLTQALQNTDRYISYRKMIYTIENLCNAGVLSQNVEHARQCFSIRVPLFKEWLNRNHPFNMMARKTKRNYHE